jgi:pimeloyl-ACP methyl ester carboxylesterase
LRLSAGTSPRASAAANLRPSGRTTRRARAKTLRAFASMAAALLCLQISAAPAALAIAESTVELPSGKVLYRDSGGAGVPVVFLHPNNIAMWEQQIPAFAGTRYRFIAIDYHGTDGNGFGPAAMTPNLARLHDLIARLALPKFHLVGVAAGGMVAFQYALAHPEQLRSLTVANSLGYLRDPQINAIERSLTPPPFAELPPEMRNLSASYRAANPEGVKRWIELTGPPPAAHAANAAPAANATGASNAAPASSAAPAPDPNAVTWPRLAHFTVPTLMVTGDADLYTPPSVLRLFTARLQNADCAIVRESGHASYWENAGEFNRLVLAFIRKH